MYYLPEKASRARQREAQRARDNRAEIIKAASHGQITRRDLYKWGIFTVTGALALKNGLSPFAPSAFADMQCADRHAAQPAVRRKEIHAGDAAVGAADADPADPHSGRRQSQQRRRHVHGPAERTPGQAALVPHRLHAPIRPTRNSVNPLTGRGPIEGRPPGEVFAHQRWSEFFPKVGYISSWAGVAANPRFHPNFPAQQTNSVWTYGTGPFVQSDAAAAAVQRPLRRADPDTDLQQHAGGPHARTTASAETKPSCTSIMRTTARKATAQRTSTTSPAPSTTTAGARRWPAATRSTPRRLTFAPRDPTAMAA